MIKPAEWVVEIAITGAIIVGLVIGGHYYVEHVEKRGYAKAVADGEAARVKASNDALKVERSLRAQLLEQDRARLEKESTKDETIDSLRRAATAGTVRLYCPSRPIQASVPTPAGPAAPGPSEQSGSPVMPEVASDIFGIVGDIAKVLRQRDALIDRYEQMRLVCNTASFDSYAK